MTLQQPTLKNTRFVILNIVILLTLIPAAFPNIKITEIMYNPIGFDIYGEYFELCNFGNQTTDLTNYTLLGVSANLSDIAIASKQCIVFANTRNKTGLDNDFFELYNVSLLYYNLTFDFTGYLNNGKDSLSLVDPNGFVIDNFTYNATLANGNGFSLNRYGNFVLEEQPSPFYYDFDLYFNLSNATQLAMNITNLSNISNLSNVTNLIENISNITQENLSEIVNGTFINESLGNQTSQINTTNQTNNNELDISSQDNISIELISIENNTVYYRILSNCSYVYWIEDLYNNIIKPPLNSSASSKKQFTSKYDLVFFIKARNSCTLQNASKIVILNNSLNQKSKVYFDYKSRYKKVKLKINVDFVRKTDLTIFCYLNNDEQIFYFHQNSLKPLIGLDFKLEFLVPTNLFKEGDNEINCKVNLYNNTKIFKERFSYYAPKDNAKTTVVDSVKKENPGVEIQSFYTFDKYLKDKNHFFINLKQISLSKGLLSLEVYELKDKLLLTKDVLNSSKQDFYLNLNKQNTTLLTLIRNNDSIITSRFLDVALLTRKATTAKGNIINASYEKENITNSKKDKAQQVKSFAESLYETSFSNLHNRTLGQQIFNTTKIKTNDSDEITSFFSLQENLMHKTDFSLKHFFIVPLVVFLSSMFIIILFRAFSRKRKT